MTELSDAERKAKQRAAQAKYRATEKGRAATHAYIHSDVHRERNRALYATPEWKEWAREYRKSERGRAVEAKYRQSGKNKLTRAKYASSEHRKTLLKKSNAHEGYQAWLKSPDGIACLRAAKARRRALKQAASVPLTNEEAAQVKGFYAEANRITIETGIPHQVDHILPLVRGGLHHPDNLQVVTQAYNCSKQDLTEEEFRLSRERGYRVRLDTEIFSP